MSAAFQSPFTVQAQHARVGADDYLSRMNAHYERATELQQARTVGTMGNTHTKWESPQALRQFGHEFELAQECQQAMFECSRMAQRAQMRHYQHACYCTVRKQKTDMAITKAFSVSLSLRALSSLLCSAKRSAHSPPLREIKPPVLSTCHASNAPGLFTCSQMETHPT